MTQAQNAMTAIRNEGYGPGSTEVQTQQKLLDEAKLEYKEKIEGIMNGLEAVVDHDKGLLDTIIAREKKPRTGATTRPSSTALIII